MERIKLWLALAPFVMLIVVVLAFTIYLIYLEPVLGLEFLGLLVLGFWVHWAWDYLKKRT